MDNYIPTIEQVRQAHKVYDEVILTLVLNPKKIVEAYRLISGSQDVLVNQKYAHRYVHSYFYFKKYLQAYPDYRKEDDVNVINAVVTKEDIIDVLDFTFNLDEKETNEIENDDKLKVISRIAELEKELTLALTSDDDKLIKSVRIKLSLARKKLVDYGK